MNIQLYGESAALSTLSARLQAQGLSVSRQAATADAPAGLRLDDMLLDLSSPSPAEALARAAQRADTYLDLSGHWQEPGVQCGFIVYAGGTPAAQQRAHPLLDKLAPIPGAWLACGPAGSATFTNQCMQGIQYALHLDTRQTQVLDAQDWLQQQQTLQRQLARLAARYLTCHPLTTAAWTAFPPATTPHFAQALASWLAFSLSQLDAWQRLLTEADRATP